MSDESTLNTKPLDQFLKMLKNSKAVARVGILGDKNSRAGGTETNAEIGAKHEFGSDGMPQRSFLRMPLMQHLQPALDKSKAFDDNVLKKVLRDATVVPWLTQVGFIAESVILEAFSTEGWGSWEPWITPGYTNNSGMILTDTGQLRNSISSEVKDA